VSSPVEHGAVVIRIKEGKIIKDARVKANVHQ